MYVKLIQPKMIKRPMETDLKTRMSPPFLSFYFIYYTKTHFYCQENLFLKDNNKYHCHVIFFIQ